MSGNDSHKSAGTQNPQDEAAASTRTSCRINPAVHFSENSAERERRKRCQRFGRRRGRHDDDLRSDLVVRSVKKRETHLLRAGTRLQRDRRRVRLGVSIVKQLARRDDAGTIDDTVVRKRRAKGDLRVKNGEHDQTRLRQPASPKEKSQRGAASLR